MPHYAYLSFSCLISGYQFYRLIVFFSAIPAQGPLLWAVPAPTAWY